MMTYGWTKSLSLAALLLAVAFPAIAAAQVSPLAPSNRTYQTNRNNRLQRNAYGRQPAVSPYLNLLRGDDFFGTANYYTLVRPQLRQNATNAREFQEIDHLQREIDTNAQPAQPRRIRRTGHVSRFMDYSGYFSGGGQKP